MSQRLCTREQNAQGDPTQILKSLPEARVQGTGDSQAGLLQDGGQWVYSPMESGQRGFEIQPPLLFSLGKLPYWNLNFLIYKMTDSYFTGKD